MSFIPEATIETMAARLGDSEEAFLSVLDQMRSEQPALAAYLFSEQTGAFTRPEQEWLLFLALVIYASVAAEAPKEAPVSEDEVIDREEANWELLLESGGKTFFERISPCFEQTRQEDLLAFVEDSLAEEEDEGIVSTEGKEPMFVMLKTIIDLLTEPAMA